MTLEALRKKSLPYFKKYTEERQVIISAIFILHLKQPRDYPLFCTLKWYKTTFELSIYALLDYNAKYAD